MFILIYYIITALRDNNYKQKIVLLIFKNLSVMMTKFELYGS